MSRVEQVVLVDRHDVAVGTREKLSAHERGELHRACSVLVFDAEGRLLLQRRAATKYHSPGLWSNTCCTHPRPGERAAVAARRRLDEELGFDCELAPWFEFVYRADVGGGLIEHEYDHVFIGSGNAIPRPNAAEVGAWRWETLPAVRRDCARRPERYTVWFRELLAQDALHGSPA